MQGRVSGLYSRWWVAGITWSTRPSRTLGRRSQVRVGCFVEQVDFSRVAWKALILRGCCRVELFCKLAAALEATFVDAVSMVQLTVFSAGFCSQQCAAVPLPRPFRWRIRPSQSQMLGSETSSLSTTSHRVLWNHGLLPES